jgi:hypothetical protein
MPGFLLHLNAQVQCAHMGRAQPTVTNPRVMVSGQPTVFVAIPHLVAGCALPPPPAANGPCITAVWTSGSTRVLSLGQPLLVTSSQAVCAPSGTPALITVTQTRASAM